MSLASKFGIAVLVVLVVLIVMGVLSALASSYDRVSNENKPKKKKYKKETKGDKARDVFIENVLENGKEAKLLDLQPELSLADMRAPVSPNASASMMTSLDELNLDEDSDIEHKDISNSKSREKPEATSSVKREHEKAEHYFDEDRGNFDPYLHV